VQTPPEHSEHSLLAPGVLAPHSEDDADINQPPLSNGCNFFGRRETRQYFLGPNRKKGVGFRSDDEMY
jgi:hypothetical protein